MANEATPTAEEGELFGDVLALYLAVGSTLGDCALYRRMGDALAKATPAALREAYRGFAALPPETRRRVLAGDTSFDPAPLGEDGSIEPGEIPPPRTGTVNDRR